jgi:hypothetical protein
MKSVALNFKCEYCKKLFAKEKTLIVHVCEKKRRYLDKNQKHVQVGLIAFQKFYDFAQKGKTQKTFDDFATSPYYTSFVKFGSFVVNTSPIYTDRFIDFIIKSGVKLDHWCKDDLYDKYISELIRIEPADGAIQRSIQTMIEWGDLNSAEWNHYFAYVNLNRATHDIKEGLISPWILLNSKSGKELLRRMSDEQLMIISPIIDPTFWSSRFKSLPADVTLSKDVIKEATIL